jgi:heat shock protein HspQ
MFEVVIEDNGSEYVAYTAENKREADLLLQRHLRSLTPGMAYIREAKSESGKK